jgi:hypothetical protein
LGSILRRFEIQSRLGPRVGHGGHPLVFGPSFTVRPSGHARIAASDPSTDAESIKATDQLILEGIRRAIAASGATVVEFIRIRGEVVALMLVGGDAPT